MLDAVVSLTFSAGVQLVFTSALNQTSLQEKLSSRQQKVIEVHTTLWHFDIFVLYKLEK